MLTLFLLASLVTAHVDDARRVALAGSRPVKAARADADLGPLDATTVLHHVSLVFARSAAQEADLQALLAAQQDPTSPLYQHWLTPDEFGARFGAAAEDLGAAQAWLEQKGLTVEGLSRARDRITVTGTAQQLAAAFGAGLHNYRAGNETGFALSADATIPSALAPLVRTVTNLSSFRPHARVRPAPAFTSGQSGSHFLTPKDLATIYDITPAYSAGLDGTGQSIAVVGQSAIAVADIEHFQSAAGVTVHDPTLVLVPNSGASTTVSGDESESDLDLEYTSSIAPGASIKFVYSGNGQNTSVWDAIQYAVDNNLARVISISYGTCEASLSSSDYQSLQSILSQAAAQGQSAVAASGDAGSTDCDGTGGLTTSEQQQLAVDFPASSQYVTGIGGTEFASADVASSNTTYWTAATGADVIGSARSYIPELVWNDDAAEGSLASGGGGTSTLTARPSWQAGVPGIPSGTKRLVPDVSLAASGLNPGYLYCSSDNSSTGVTGSCANGFRDANGDYLTVAGGTSFAAPVFAGLVALLNQRAGSSGQGVVAKTLYSLASTPSTYASAFHDVTTGGNQCATGSTKTCSSTGASASFATGGYDTASGLGSVDFANLVAVWPTSGTPVAGSTTTAVRAASVNVASGASDQISIDVTSSSGIPAGSVSVLVDGVAAASLTLSNGVASWSFTSSSPGTHTITASYAGDGTYLASRGSVTVTVVAGSPGFTLSATDVTVAATASGVATITVTPQGAYTGTVTFAVSSTPSLTQGCFSIASAVVNGTQSVAQPLTIEASSSSCGTALLLTPRTSDPLRGDARGEPLLGLGFVALARANRRRRRFIGLALAAASLLSCGGNSVASSGANSTKGTYVLTVTGTDSATLSFTASTTLTLTID